jgi:hypothetical protein
MARLTPAESSTRPSAPLSRTRLGSSNRANLPGWWHGSGAPPRVTVGRVSPCRLVSRAAEPPNRLTLELFGVSLPLSGGLSMNAPRGYPPLGVSWKSGEAQVTPRFRNSGLIRKLETGGNGLKRQLETLPRLTSRVRISWHMRSGRHASCDVARRLRLPFAVRPATQKMPVPRADLQRALEGRPRISMVICSSCSTSMGLSTW